MVVALKAPSNLCNAKRSVRNLLKGVEGAARFAKELCQFDSMFADRVRRWKGIDDLKPQARPRDSSVEAFMDWVRGWGRVGQYPIEVRDRPGRSDAGLGRGRGVDR